MAHYRKVAGIHFIRVRGNAHERAAQHGALLKEHVRTGALQALARKNEWLIRNAPGLARFKPAQDSIVWVYKKVLLPMLLGNNAHDTGRVRALANASGISPDPVLESLLQPDALMLLSRLTLMKHFLRDIPSAGLPGCTSAVALGTWTKSGKLLVCRNLDYPIVGPWERNTTIVFNVPTDRGELPHVSVASAGIPVAGLTSINAEGLTLATHAHFGSRVSLRGRSIGAIGEDVISRARTIGQAVDIARKNRRIGNWAFVISSAREQDAAVIEMTPTETRVRHPSDGFLAHTNLFQSDLNSQEGLISGGSYEDMLGRICRVREILEQKRSILEPRHMAEALGDHMDPQTGEERVVGNIISVVTTIGSVVFEPESLRLWVSNRNESPTGLGEFLEVNTETFWTMAGNRRPRLLQGYRPKSPALPEAARLYREAYQAWHMDNHLPGYRERTYMALKRAVEAFPTDGCLWVQTGILAFSLRRFDEARHFLEKASERPLSRHVGNVRDLFYARCNDIAGDRQSALRFYRMHSRIRDPKLRKAMREGLKRRYRVSDTVRLMLDLQFADAVLY